MSFDPRSLERLRQLGRSLPQPLPAPQVATPPPPSPAPQGRHKVETETDPEALFGELMQASADGTVPPHLLDRLRQLEAERRRRPGPAPTPAPAQASSARPLGPASPRQRAAAGLGRPDPRLLNEHGDLYTAFQQLLLEGDEESQG